MPAERPSTAQDAAADDDATRRTSGIARFTPSFFTGSGGTRKSSITAAMLESAISSQVRYEDGDGDGDGNGDDGAGRVYSGKI